MNSYSNNLESAGYINLPKLFLRLLFFITRKIKTILIFWTITMIAYIYYFYAILPPQYSSSMIVYSTNYTLEDFSVLTDRLNNFIESGSYEILSKELGITPSEAEKIKKFSVTLVEFNKTKKEKGTTYKEDKFDINVLVTDNSILSRLNKGFSRFILSNPFLDAMSFQRRYYVNSLKEKIVKEQKSLDSLKSNYVDMPFLNRSANAPSIVLGNLGAMYESSVKLFKEGLDMDYELKFGVDFVVINEFSPNVPVLNKNLLKSLIIFSLISISMIVLYLGIAESIKKYSV